MIQLDIQGKCFAITGKLPILRTDAIAKLNDMGGIYKTSVTRDTHYLIVGELRRVSHKFERANDLMQTGYDLVIVDGQMLFAESPY